MKGEREEEGTQEGGRDEKDIIRKERMKRRWRTEWGTEGEEDRKTGMTASTIQWRLGELQPVLM